MIACTYLIDKNCFDCKCVLESKMNCKYNGKIDNEKHCACKNIIAQTQHMSLENDWAQ